MTRLGIAIFMTMALGPRAAEAQTTRGVADADPWVAELTVGAARGLHVSIAFAVEAGYSLTDRWQLFIETARTGNVATADLDRRAQRIADFFGASVTAMQRATVIETGVKYQLAPINVWRPYVLAGLGAARVTTQAAFGLHGADVTSQLLGQYGVQLGSDLSGGLTKFLVTLGGGFTMPLRQRYIVDVGYRYDRISPKFSEINNDVTIHTHRVQAGIGVRF